MNPWLYAADRRASAHRRGLSRWTRPRGVCKELLPGLYQSDIDSWKKQFESVYHLDVKGDQFIIRSLERFEYKEIIAMPNADPLMREEVICEYCVLYPQGYNFATMANKKAGIPAVLSEFIMEQSGFTREVKVTKL